MGQEDDTAKVQEAAEKLLVQAQRARRAGQLTDAKRHLHQAASLCRQLELPPVLARTLAMLGQIARDEKQIDSALSHYEEALKIFREVGVPDRVAHTIRHIGDIHRSRGSLELAEPCYNEALQIYRSGAETNPLDLANAIRGHALLKGEMKAYTAARRLWHEAKELYEKVNVKEGVRECEQQIIHLDSLRNSST